MKMLSLVATLDRLAIGHVVRALLCLALIPTAHAAGPLVDVGTSPLYGGRQAHPNVTVTTSVEFPTVGAAYLNVPYVPTSLYAGYFDNTQCYGYNDGNQYFYPVGAASSDGQHECNSQSNNAFSGNFMNWASMSAIDEFRYAMTGGNRSSERAGNGGTLIERAYLPDGSINGVPSFYAYNSNFPRHTMLNGYIDGTPSSDASAVLPNNILHGTGHGLKPLYVTSCRTFIYFGSTLLGDCNSPSQEVGAFRVQVLVCDATEGPQRTDLCLQYGGTSGLYKPVGQTQLNADRMRFAAFGYLMDHETTGYSPPCNNTGWNRCRYGGVLRAPMKYVGPTTYNANQIASANPKAEINTDGTLASDPEGTAGSAGGQYSGFINYINKFGSDGVYKRFDPAGEMYYEAIRYYQGLQPTSLADDGYIDNDIKGHYPYTHQWSDPIQTSCAQNYIINLSDANTWDDTYLPGFNGAQAAGYGRPGSRPAENGLDA